MQRILKLPLANAIADSALRESIWSITAESYANPDILLGQEYKKNNQVYLSLTLDGTVEAFFMVGWSDIELHDKRLDCVFLGLSAVTTARKGGVLAVNLYRRFFEDAGKVSASSGQAVTWWFHTASPIVAGILQRLRPDMSPHPDGAVLSAHRDLLAAIQRSHGFTPFLDPGIPCVLRGFAQARYAPSEVARLESRSSRNLSLIDRWKVDESSGDRVLFVGECHP